MEQFHNIGWQPTFIVPGGTSDKCFAIPQELSFENKRTLINDLQRIVQASSIPIAYEMKPDARELYAQWYKTLKEKRSFFSKRLDTYAARLMPLFAINNGFGRDYKIDCAMVERTTRLCDWQMSVREAFSPIDADNRTARMEEKIRRVLKEGGGAMKERDLQKRVHAHREGLYIYNAGRRNLMDNQEIYASKGSIILGPSS